MDSEDLAEGEARTPQSQPDEDVLHDSAEQDAEFARADGDVDQQEPDDEEEDPALAERRRVWEDFQDQYFDGE